MQRYRIKPAIVEAVQWMGFDEGPNDLGDWGKIVHIKGNVPVQIYAQLVVKGQEGCGLFPVPSAPRGGLVLQPGDWLVKAEGCEIARVEGAHFDRAFEKMPCLNPYPFKEKMEEALPFLKRNNVLGA